ncbi:MAG: hypothetical protein AAGB93_16820 [Planctomycetota bacterium]
MTAPPAEKTPLLSDLPLRIRIGASLVAAGSALWASAALIPLALGSADVLVPLLAAIVAVLWLVFGLPFALHHGGRRPIPSPGRCAAFGALAGTTAVAAWCTFEAIVGGANVQRYVVYMVAMSGVFGATGVLVGTAYRSLVVRWAEGGERWTPVVLGVAAFLVPGAVFPLAVWPSLERAAPRLAYALGSEGAQVAIQRRVALSVLVGESGSEVAERIPGGPWPGMQSGTATVGGTGWRIEVVDGRVVAVDRTAREVR